MRLTKVLRDYAKNALNEKSRAKAKEFSAPYHTERDKVVAECEAVVKEARAKVFSILTKYGFDTELTGWRSGKAEEKILQFSEGYIMKEKEEDNIRNYEADLRNTINKALNDLELECALGANRETFMAFIEGVEL